MTEVKRVFVGGLSPEVTQEDLKDRFQKFGEVLDVQFKKKQESEDTPEKIFAYLNVKSTPENLKKCISLYNKTKWKGSELRLQLAKENFLTRLEMERKNGFKVEEKKKKADKKKDSYEFHNPFENLPEPSTHDMKGCVPGTKVPGEENWVVGKYGRVLPIVYVRNKEKRKIVKVDPSKFCHNVKRMKDDDTTNLSKQKNLTLSIDDVDSEIVKKRKGEFPDWKPSPNKQKKIDYEKLRELYMNDNSKSRFNNVDTEPDFEIVSGNLNVSGLGKTYDSDDSDSDSYYTSLKNPQSKSLSKNGNFGQPDNKNNEHSYSRYTGANSSDNNNSNCDSESHSDMEITQTCDTNKGFNSNIKKDPLKRAAVKESDTIQRTSLPSSNSMTKPRILNQNSNKQSQVTKPKMKPFGGTKMLYQETLSKNDTVEDKTVKSMEKHDFVGGAPCLRVTEKPNVKSKTTPSNHQNNKVHNTSSNISTGNELVTNKNKVKPKPLKDVPSDSITITDPLSKSSDSEEDGKDSASSADTDEIINSSKSRTPSHVVSDSKQKKSSVKISNTDEAKWANGRTSLNSNLNLSSIDEFSSGLIEGDFPLENDFSGKSEEEDSDESDFEKFALKELQKANHLKEKETSKLVNTINDDKFIKKGKTENRVTGTQIKSKSDRPLLSESNGKLNMETVINSSKREVIMDDSDSENKGSNSSDGNDSDDEESNGTSDGYLKSDSSSSSSEGSLSDDENSDSDSSIENITAQNQHVDSSDSDGSLSDDEDSDSDSSIESNSAQKQHVDSGKKSPKNEITKNAKDLPKNNKPTDEEKLQDDGPKQQSDRKSVTPNKNVDKKRKQDLDTNKKRLESVKQRQMENQAQKSIIQKALANIDGTDKSNKKIIFDDSESEDNNPPSNVQQILSKDSSDSDSDIGEEDTIKQKKVTDLFDSSEEDSSDNDKEMFKIRPEFEGRSGQQRMELQSRYGNDDRFRLDKRFIDSDNDEAPEEPEIPVDEDEKTKSLKILEEVIGSKIITAKKGKLFKDVSALHFDPNREDHAQYEVKTEPPKKDKKGTKKKKVTEETKNEDITEELPEVGKEKFFEVSNSLMDAFKPGSKTTDEPQGFSLLSAFGCHGDKDAVSDDDEENEGMAIKTLKHKSNMYPWQQQFDDESSDSDRIDEDLDRSSEDEDEKTQNKAVVFSSSKSFFFFQENDERIAEGIKNFCRQESLEVIREKWLEKRPDLVEAYRTKHKRLVRKVKMDKKHTKKQIPHRRH